MVVAISKQSHMVLAYALIGLGGMFCLTIFNGFDGSGTSEAWGWNLGTVLGPIIGIFLMRKGFQIMDRNRKKDVQ